MPKNQPTVSVIIPARDSAAMLPAAISSISSQSYTNIIEIVVAAADEESARVAAAAGARVVSNPSGSTPSGLNLAIQASRGEIIVRCDAQAVLPEDYVSLAVDTLLDREVANVGGRQVPVGNGPTGRDIAAAMINPLGAGDARYRVGGQAGPVETVYLGVFRRAALAELGAYDERFVRTQDYELNHRIVESGGVVWFDPRLEVTYTPRSTFKALARQYFQYGQAKRLFHRVHPGSLRLRQIAPPVFVIVLIALLVASIWYPLLLLLAAVYPLALIGAGIRSEAGRWWGVALALATMHLSWGLGFLIGPKR